MQLTEKQIQAFAAVVDTILPPARGDGPAWTMSGGDMELAEGLPGLVDALPHDDVRTDLVRLLGMLSSPAGGLLLYRRPRAFTALSPEQSPDAFRAMLSSPIGMVRAGARALKFLTARLWMTTTDPGSPPLPWEAIGYPGPAGPPPDVPKTITTIRVATDTTIDTDVVIVGSGAGGGTAAGVLAGAGLGVVVLDAGGYHNESDFTHLEADAYQRMYLQGLMGTTTDGGMGMVAGATLGGGTVINYTSSFPTPPDLREEWDRMAGFDGVFTGEGYEDSSRAVQERLQVNTDNGSPSSRERLMEEGLRTLGWHVAEQPRNAVGCAGEQCGYCTMGCRIGAKQSTLLTYLADASVAGAVIVPGAEVSTITLEDGRATGVVADVDGQILRVRARSVVVAAGALNTPAILMRSGVGGKTVGRYLWTHPVTAVWGRFPEPVHMWTGSLQARYSDQCANLDGRGCGFKFETAPVHPLFPAVFLGWGDGQSFKDDVLGMAHLSLVAVLVRDRDHGRVVLRQDGTPRWRYSISRYDQRHIREGVIRGAEVLAASGAEEIISSSNLAVRWRPLTEPHDRFVEGVDAAGYASNRISYLSFHQMGSARMGSDPSTSVVDDYNQAHHTPGLYVMDASCFPSASGVNPMISIASIAHRGATLLAERLA
jgi:long-chain-alcohol oxidase